jgi:hypothetical protein
MSEKAKDDQLANDVEPKNENASKSPVPPRENSG